MDVVFINVFFFYGMMIINISRVVGRDSCINVLLGILRNFFIFFKMFVIFVEYSCIMVCNYVVILVLFIKMEILCKMFDLFLIVFIDLWLWNFK